MSSTVTSVRHCWQYTQPLSLAVRCGNDSYNTNNPSASSVTVISDCSHSCSCTTYTRHSYCPRAAFISLRASDNICSYYSRSLRAESICIRTISLAPCGPVVLYPIFFSLHLSALFTSQKYSGSEKHGSRSSFKLSRKIPFIKKRETSLADGGDDSKRKEHHCCVHL